VAFPAWMSYVMIVRVVAAARRKKRWIAVTLNQ
jgi:hypothetical protein